MISNKLYPEYDTEHALAIILEKNLLMLAEYEPTRKNINEFLSLLMDILQDE